MKTLCRRNFLKGAGASFLSLLSYEQAEAFSQHDVIFASCCKKPDGRFSLMLADEKFSLFKEIPLPDRGHDITFNSVTGQGVVFARRPGTFAVAFDHKARHKPKVIAAKEGRHFYGHGVFSKDGKLLYVTENNYEEAHGVIGVYDAGNNFNRLGEFESHGIGPHDILLSPDDKTLIVANGGIETHPDYGREKLNLATMEPNLAFIDCETGSLRESHQTSSDLNQLSIRHMAVNEQGRVVFGCQFEGVKTETPPLIGWSEMGEGLHLWDSLEPTICQRENYIGSVAISQDGQRAAISAPRNNGYAIISIKDGKVLQSSELNGVCGVAAKGEGFAVSTDKGFLGNFDASAHQAKHDMAFDNHMVSFRLKNDYS